MRKSCQSTTEFDRLGSPKKNHAFSLCPRPQACVDVTAHARFARSQVVAGTPPHLVCHNSSSVGRLWPNLPHCVAQRHQSTRFSMQRVEALSGRCVCHVEKGLSHCGLCRMLWTTIGASAELLGGKSHGETNVQAAGARVRLGRAAAAKVASL